MIVVGEACPTYPWHGQTLPRQLHSTATAHPDLPAFITANRRLDWATAERTVRSIAKGLVALDLRSGDKLALWMPNSIEWALVWLAAAHLGVVTVPVNTRYKMDDARWVLSQSDARMLVMVDRFLDNDYTQMLSDMIPSWPSPGAAAAGGLSDLRRVVVLGETPPGALSWDQMLEGGQTVSDVALDELTDAVRVEDPTIIVYTSGTTGRPKGVVHTHEVLRNEASVAGHLQIEPSDRILGHMPFFHVAGAFTCILPGLVSGAALLPMEKWDPAEAVRLMKAERVSVLGGVPTHYIDILSQPDLPERDSLTLKVGWIGGAVLPKEVIDGALDDLGMQAILTMYGMTETTSVTSLGRTGDSRDMIYAGKGLPSSDFEMKVADSDGHALPPGVEGEVFVRGHVVMQGYYGNEAATSAVLEPEGWFHTGDLGMLDEQSYLSITGRTSDVFFVGGSKVYPVEVEAVLAKHPSVSQAFVVGAPDPRLGQTGTAFVQFKQGERVSETDIAQFCKADLPSYKVPSKVKFVDAWPETATGKIARGVLLKMAMEA